MTKPTPADHDIFPLFGERWSPLSFSDEWVSDDDIRSLFEAARWAPSSYNEQPWAFVFARKGDAPEFERILSCLVESNQVWARRAALLMIGCTRKRFQRNGKPNRYAVYDLGAAMMQLSLQATSLGIGVHQMAGFLPDKAAQELEIPDTHQPVVAIAIGYRGPVDQLPEGLRAREQGARRRASQDAFVHLGQWGASYDD
jgi:nitroreductase